VHLKEFSLVSPKIQSTEIFKAIEAAIPATLIEQAIAKTKVTDYIATNDLSQSSTDVVQEVCKIRWEIEE
jgi:hypothetical protein